MKHSLLELETETFAAEREWTVDGIPVLTAAISLPRPLHQEDRSARRIDRFYQLQGHSYLRYCEKFLFPKAASEYRQALADSAPLPLGTAVLSYRVTCSERGVWSLYTDTRESCNGRHEVHRRGDTWDLSCGYPIALSACFPHRFPIRKTLLRTAQEDIQRQENAGIARYHEGWRQELRRQFRRENFYLAPDGLRFFWQMHALASAAEGIPVFTLPFSADGCHWPVSILQPPCDSESQA